MDDGQKEVIRTALEIQFRYKFYQDPVFPFYQSMGIKDVLQGFGNDDVGWIGMLHLWWVPEESNIHFDNPREWPVKIIGVWKGEWLETAQEGMELAEKIQNDKPFDLTKMLNIHVQYQKEIENRHMKKLIEEQIEKLPPEEKKILWN